MPLFRNIWILYNIALIFQITVPGIGITLQTLLALPLIFQNLFSFPLTKNLYGITRLLLFILIAVLVSGFLGDNFNPVYQNFVFWIVNAFVFLKTINQPYFRDLAIKTWAYSIIGLCTYRMLIILGMPSFPFMPSAKNAIGIVFSVFLPVALIYFRFKWKQNQFWFCFLLAFVILIFNGSRSTILAFSFVSIILIYQIEIKILKKYRYFLIIPFSISLSLILLPVLRAQNAYLDQRVADVLLLFSPDYNVRDVEASSFSLRYLVMEKALDLYKENPMYGVGLYNFQEYHGTKFDYFLRYVRKKNGGLNAHNSYLSMLSETGLLGFIPFMLIILYIISQITQSLFNQKRNPNLYSLIGAGMAIGLLIEMFFVYNIISISTWTYLVAIFPLTAKQSKSLPK